MRARLPSLLTSTSGNPASKTHLLQWQVTFCCKPLEQQDCKHRSTGKGKPLYVASTYDRKQVSIHSHIQILCQQGLLRSALLCLDDLSSPASHNVYISLLKACHRKKSLPYTHGLLTHLVVHSLEFFGFLGEHSVVAFVKCGALDDALDIFHRLPCRRAFSWTSIISGFTDCCHDREALQMYVHMVDDRVEPDPYTFVSLFKACGNINNLEVGRRLHAMAQRKGLTSDVYAATTMVSMYGKCGAIKEAENVFIGVPRTDVILWNALLSAYVEGDHAEKALQLYIQMQVEGLSPDKQTLVIALQACGTLAVKEASSDLGDGGGHLTFLEIGRALHEDARRKGFTSDISVSTTLVSMYGKCGASCEAENAFGELCSMDVVPCTAMLSAYVDGDEKAKALKLYRQMQREGATPNQQTLVCALQACALFMNKDGIISLEGHLMKKISLEFVRAIHCDALRRGQAWDLFVSNALVSLYGKCGAIGEAENVFDRLFHPDVVSWTAMLSIYVDFGYGQKALQLYRQMLKEGVSPNHHTYVMALQACGILCEEGIIIHVKDEQSARLTSLEIVRALHVDVERRGLASDVFIAATLVVVYGKCGSVVEAEHVFQSWPECTAVLRNAMLSTFVEHGQGYKVLKMYEQIHTQKFGPDVCTLICVLQACSDIGTVDTGRKLHFDIISAGLELQTFLASALIHAYGRNASMLDAEVVAYGLPWPDVASWNACIAGYAGEGQCVASLQMFEEMQQAECEPNGVSFTSLFSGCSHAGLVDQGIHYFDVMSRHGCKTPEMKHYVNIVDLLGRAGDFRKVRDLLQKMAIPADADTWSCLLGACCTHGNLGLGKLAFLHVVDLQPQQHAPYVLMSNIHADRKAAGTVEEV